MNVQALNAYLNPNVNRVQENMKISNVRIQDKENTNITYEPQENVTNNPENIISNNEREYFMKLFPENSQQIENHILFNRNGRLHQPNISKGSLLDGKI